MENRCVASYIAEKLYMLYNTSNDVFTVTYCVVRPHFPLGLSIATEVRIVTSCGSLTISNIRGQCIALKFRR